MQLLDIVTKDSTDRSVVIRIIDSSDGTPETGVEHNTSGIDLWYRREGAAKVSITEAALADLTTAHTDGGIEHIGDGAYRLDLPDAAFATGANYVDVGGTVTGMIVIGGRVRLVDVDLEDTVRAGLTALPNAAADEAGGLPISDAGGLDIDALASNVTDVLTDTGTTLPGLISAVQSTADAIEADTQDLQTQVGVAGAGLTSVPWNSAWDAETQSEVADALTAYNAVATTDLPTNFSSLGIEVDGDITKVNTLDGHTAQTADHAANIAAILTDTGTTLPATLATIAGYIDTEVAAIKAVTDNLPDSGALSSLATASALATVDTVVDAIKAVTDLLSGSAGTIVSGTVDTATNGHTPTTTEFQADDITEEDDDHYNGRVIIFTSGELQNQATSISDYAAVGGIGQFTVVALTEAPANNDTFIII